MGVVGELGLVHRDITGPPPRDPFTKTSPSPTATYPALWNHSATNETRMVGAPDSQLLVRRGMEAILMCIPFDTPPHPTRCLASYGLRQASGQKGSDHS